MSLRTRISVHVFWAVLVACCCTSLAAADDAPFQSIIDPETLTDLPRYPYNHELAKGWYTREMIVRGWTAGARHILAIHETATDTQLPVPLDRSIPPGKYKIFLRVLGPTTSQRPTRVRLNFGNTVANFEWETSRRWQTDWLKPLTIELAEPASELTITAMQFGGQGYGVMYEPQHRSIWLDSIYITSDLEASAPSPDQEHVIRGGTSVNQTFPRRPYPSDDTGPSKPTTPSPIRDVQIQPVLLKSTDGRPNHWPDGSFELGLTGGWAADTRKQTYAFTEADLDDSHPLHGRFAFRVPPGVSPFSPTRYLAKPGVYTLSASTLSKSPATVTLKRVIAPGETNFNRKNLSAKVAMRFTIPAGSDWQRGSDTAELDAGWYYMSFDATAEGYHIDAVQLEAGPSATAFAPRHNIEAAIFSGQPGNIIYPQQKNLFGRIHHSGDQPQEVSVTYRVFDVREQLISEGATDPVTVQPGETRRIEWDIMPKLFGIFSIQYAISGRTGLDGELVIVRMPKPSDKPTRHELGANMSFDPVEMALQKRLGLDWVLTCKTRRIAAAKEGAQREPGQWVFLDEEAKRAGQHDMQQVIGLWPHRVPDWMAAPAQPQRTIRGKPPSRIPQTDLWRKHVRTIAEHYKRDILWWCVDDETELSWNATELANIVNATLDEIEAVSPQAKVGFSSAPEFLEEVLAAGVDVSRLGHLGGSTYDYNDLEAERVAHLQKRYDLPWICYGVGVLAPVRTMYHSLYTYHSAYPKAVQSAQRVVNLFLIQDVKVAGHYAGVLRNDGDHESLNNPLLDYDGTPIPWGATFGILGTNLADAEPLYDVKLGSSRIMVRMFRLNGQLGAVTYATNQRGYDLHDRPWPRAIPEVTIASDLEVLDMFWNPRSGVTRNKGSVKFQLTEEPTFFFSQNSNLDNFAELFKHAKLSNGPVAVDLAWQSSEESSPALQATITNHTDRAWDQVWVDLRSADHSAPMENAAMHLFAEPVQRITRLEPDESATVTFATLYRDKMPVEAGSIRVHVGDNNGFIGAHDDQLWLMYSQPKHKVEIDGQLDEWSPATASWASYNWAWILLSRRESQIIDGAGAFGLPPYSVDARASFWSGWDETNLYIAIRLHDDQLLDEERIQLQFRCDQQAATVELKPEADATLHIGDRSIPLKAAKGPGTFEVAVPWDALGVTPSTCRELGFDLKWTDADKEDGVTTFGTLRWAGKARNLGTLILHP